MVNKTGLPIETIKNYWRQAAVNIAMQPIVLNAASVVLQGVKGNTVPPDRRAISVKPNCFVRVYLKDDVTVAELVRQTNNIAWSKRTNPTGLLLLDGMAVHGYCSFWLFMCFVYGVKSNPSVLIYEFENVILAKLGYNTRER